LNQGYENWIKRYARQHRVLIIDTDDLDLAKDTSRLHEIIKQVEFYETQIELFPKIPRI
jgi:deoxyadenosine/deoxycytidine kinase